MTNGQTEKAPEETRSTYRSGAVRIAVVVIATMGFLFVIGGLSSSEGAKTVDVQILAGASLLASALILVRGLLIGVLVREGGILVRNFFHSFHLRWDEIERFELKYHLLTLTPSMCHVVLLEGRTRPITSIVQTTFEALGWDKKRAATMIDELNGLADSRGQAHRNSA
jgi:hypothetical protein